MSVFTAPILIKKLESLNSTQESIQTISLYLIHHRKHCKAIVDIWMREVVKANEERQLTLFYLANDVIQTSRRKGPEFGEAFAAVLKKIFAAIGAHKRSESNMFSIMRLLNIWELRNIYDKELIKDCKKILGAKINTAVVVRDEPALAGNNSNVGRGKPLVVSDGSNGYARESFEAEEKSRDRKTRNGDKGEIIEDSEDEKSLTFSPSPMECDEDGDNVIYDPSCPKINSNHYRKCVDLQHNAKNDKDLTPKSISEIKQEIILIDHQIKNVERIIEIQAEVNKNKNTMEGLNVLQRQIEEKFGLTTGTQNGSVIGN